MLYRHWSLFDSIMHTPATACKFRVWTMKGKKRLQEFLADMGYDLFFFLIIISTYFVFV